jgi:hypothetical protein
MASNRWHKLLVRSCVSGSTEHRCLETLYMHGSTGEYMASFANSFFAKLALSRLPLSYLRSDTHSYDQQTLPRKGLLIKFSER